MPKNVPARGRGSAPERNTRQRQLIRELFSGAERPLSPEDVVAAAQRRDRRAVSLSTVYRAIRVLVDEGWLAVVELPGSAARYEMAGKAHHHHFVCDVCNAVYELEGCTVTDSLKLPRGFRAVSHDVTIAGTCARCRSRKSSAPEAAR